MKYPEMDWGTMEAVVNKLGGMSGVKNFLRGDLLVVPSAVRNWRQEGEVISINVESSGATGRDWIASLAKQKICTGRIAEEILLSKNVIPTSGIVYNVVILNGSYFPNPLRTEKSIYEEARRRRWKIPGIELACLLRERISDKDLQVMDLELIVIMHDPFSDVEGVLHYFLALRGPDNSVGLGAVESFPEMNFREKCGFAFVASYFHGHLIAK
jgi:hypothetical protein